MCISFIKQLESIWPWTAATVYSTDGCTFIFKCIFKNAWMLLLYSGHFPTNPSELCKECVPATGCPLKGKQALTRDTHSVQTQVQSGHPAMRDSNKIYIICLFVWIIHNLVSFSFKQRIMMKCSFHLLVGIKFGILWSFQEGR